MEITKNDYEYEYSINKKNENEIMVKDNKSSNFYENINFYYEKSYAILALMVDYFKKTNRSYNKEFMTIHFKRYKFIESTIKLQEKHIEKILVWIKNPNRNDDEIYNSIFKMEIDIDNINKIFLFKVFDFDNGDIVLAGYAIDDSVSTRSFLASLNEMKMKQKYEKILNII